MEKDLKKDGGKALLDDSLAKKAAMEKVSSIICVRVCSYILSFVYEYLNIINTLVGYNGEGNALSSSRGTIS